MTIIDTIVVMAEGNPGAARVMADIMKQIDVIDPDSALGPLGPLCTLDNLDCYGPRIWMLYKNVCGENLIDTVGVLRAAQLGIVGDTDINAAIDGKTPLDVADTLAKVRERLPSFGPDGEDW